MSGRGAAPPCISLFDLFPMASIAFHFGLHGFDASAFTFVRTSYRLLGWVTFVHHSVKQHVRRLPALGYDSLEYFIFYIPSEYIGFGQIVWPILHTFTFWILNFTEAREHPHTDPGQTFRATGFPMNITIMRFFAELGSSPASMEAAKVIDVLGSQPGYSKQQADARQAYTQALFKGIETWVRLPRNRWPKEWGTKFQDPVVPLRLVLYGHPDSGGIWEKHCEDQLRTVGWVAVLPEIWQSIFYHPELDLLLVIYVDDFKMAGPTNNLAKGWKTIESVIDMDPPEPFGR